jgi:cellulase/cellobiase CelA1
VAYVLNDWGAGFVATVTVTNGGSSAINGWTLRWSFAGNQTITNAWNSVTTRSGQAVTATNASWNGAIPAGGSVNFGFQATYSGTNAVPASFTLNGATCTRV